MNSKAPDDLTSLANEDPLNYDAHQLVNAFKAGQLKVLEHTERVLALAKSLNSKIGAFSSLHPEYSLAQAAKAQAAIDENQAHELTGVPFPIKDLVQIAGLPFSAGSQLLKNNIAQVTDSIAEQLIAAQTVLIGKTTTSEFGMSVFSESELIQARTPWDLSRTAGGSSGGAGAAVAAGIVPIAHGNDAGGSVRVPAACNGVLGLLTGRGVVSNGPFNSDYPGFSRHGLLARSVKDLKLGLEVIRHHRPGDLFNPPLNIPIGNSLSKDPLVNQKLKIAMILEPMVAYTDLHPEVLAAVARAKSNLEDLGHRVQEIPAPLTPSQWQNFFPIWSVSAATLQLENADQGLQPGALTRWLREKGSEFSGVEYLQALKQVQALSRSMGEVFANFDLVLTPVLSKPVVKASEIPLEPAADFKFQSEFTPFTSVWNMNGLSALSVPIHRAAAAPAATVLPFAVQLGATRPGQELLLLEVAEQLETIDPWPKIIKISAK